MASDPTAVTKLFEQLPLEAMQQVSDSYLAWYVDRVTRSLDETIAGLRAELRENDAKEAGFRPSPQELGAIERLQRSGVTGVDLLDRMVEQGEDWLVLTMRRLDHFERTGLAPKDYSTWCEHALSGAYDWIDHDQLSKGPAASPTPGAPRQAPAPQAQAQQAQASPSVPDWLNRGNSGGGRSQADVPTAPVPAQRWSDSGYYGPDQRAGGNGAAGGSGGKDQRPDDDDKGGRNIFRIFSS
jgi:hypothetical protein